MRKAELPVDDASYQRDRPRITRLKNLRGEVLVGEETSTARPLVVHGDLTRVTDNWSELGLDRCFDTDHRSLISSLPRTARRS